MVTQPSLTYEEARAAAEVAASEVLRQFAENVGTPLLESHYLESLECWMFFRNRAIQIPVSAALHADWAYAVSRAGEVRQIVDYYDDPQKARDYLRVMSDFFARRMKASDLPTSS
jgi:hypothetical protein